MEKVQNKITPNAAQKECIETIKGPVMVLAGPGTGKTFVVVERIKNMLTKGIEPEKILCLAFSEAAASEMKRRLIQKAGAMAGRVNVYTYHGFCLEVIQNNPEYFEEFSGFSIINETQKRKIIRQCIQEQDIKYFKTKSGDKLYYTGEILLRIDEIKKNLLSKDEYNRNLVSHPEWGKALVEAKAKIKETIANGKKVPKNLEDKVPDLEKKIGQARELWRLFESYTIKMRELSLLDFNDMIALVLMKFSESASFLDKIASNYDYFLVDEYQDTNNSQNALVFSFVDAKEEKNIFVVGDDDQIIYAFQGAQIDNIEKFLLKYPNTKVICLVENMRSTQSILNLSEAVANLDSNRLQNNPQFKKYNIDKHLVAKNPEITQKDKMPEFHEFEDIVQEYNAIIDKIQEIIEKDNPKLSQIAILTKKNEELEEFAELLKGRGIPYELKEGKSIFSTKASLLTIFYLKMLLNHAKYADKIFPLLLTEPFSLNIDDYNDLLAKSYLHKNREFISDLYELKNKEGYEFKEPQKVEKLLADFEYLTNARASLNIYQLVLEVINKTGIMEFFVNNPINREENIAALKRLADEAKAFLGTSSGTSLADFIEYLDDSFENGNKILAQKPPVVKNAVQLVTMHSSKGREFEYVFIPTLEEFRWEKAKGDKVSSKVPISKVVSEEEKKELKNSQNVKLLFVAITRAKHFLYMSVPKSIANSKKNMTKYIKELDNKGFFTKEENTYTDENFVLELSNSLQYKCNYKDEFQNFIQSTIESLSISPTMMNTYINCPMEFFNTYVLRLQELNRVDDILNFGSAIHKTIEEFSKLACAKKSYPSVEEFSKMFNQNIKKTPFSSRETRLVYIERGEENLSKFYNQLILEPIDKIFSTEQNIEAKIGSDIKINGKIDRLEVNDDGTFTVVDFKTGSAKSKYTIKEGGTNEKYLNQLKFYKYLVEKKYQKTVSLAKLVFVEQCHENFSANALEFDNDAFEAKIKEVYNNILNQKFEPTSDKSNCKFCKFKNLCELNIL